MIRRLEARRFRNLEPLSLELEPGSTLLFGPTGAGKTSVLEALYVAATTRSFRTSRLEDCAGPPDHEEEPSFWVALELDGARRSRLEVAWSGAGGLERRVDGERLPIADHLDRQPMLAFSWEDGETWVAEPDLRRRFVDRGLVAERASALERLSRYRRVLAHKRSLLADGARRVELEAWNGLFAEAAAAVVALRASYVERLAIAMSEAIARSGLELPGVAFSYRPSPPAAADAEALLEHLAARAEAEIEARRPLVGPHRDAVDLSFRGQPVARVASSGERRALALLAATAQSSLLDRAGRSPAILVDDADVELDRPTLSGVWRALDGGAPKDRQLLLSSNRPEVWDGLGPDRRIRLGGGRAEAV